MNHLRLTDDLDVHSNDVVAFNRWIRHDASPLPSCRFGSPSGWAWSVCAHALWGLCVPLRWVEAGIHRASAWLWVTGNACYRKYVRL